ncbi:conserved hypothetical protein [Nitrosopumilaceae archaeon]|nr:DUF2075 domain-containing protein [Nitrosopumilus sp.]CAI9831633.1 conserved hypothetical protein [Nitrosopumilaceae archaeon]MDA7945338.1 DUF2075 domain-containing protein [Nitrosopumilus sp.]MDA7955314.1 DUF2075 domain-containing protein [Nitrosopumilus sp.]MDA7974278.1 DUF2075 domain-containing protein [Nitrosopumilus sp.]
MGGWQVTVKEFLDMSPKRAFEKIMANCPTQKKNQEDAWRGEIRILRDSLQNFTEGHLVFEYDIPRIEKRMDVVLIESGIIFVMEFKVDEKSTLSADMAQCMEYALALKNFHEESRDAYIMPILIPTLTDAEMEDPRRRARDPYYDKVFDAAVVTPGDLAGLIKRVGEECGSEPDINPSKWFGSRYSPIPTIIEAANIMYRDHDVADIGTDRDSRLLRETVDSLSSVIEESIREKRKSVCFLTGIPGSGKTLVGLNLVAKRRELDDTEDKRRTLFLSGNRALVDVLQEALAQDDYRRNRGSGTTKGQARQKSASFIQHMMRHRDDFLREPDRKVVEDVIVLDEAQRVWTGDKLAQHIKSGYGSGMSEPELVLDMLAGKREWAVLVCLVGDGQEIKKEETGLGGWLDAVERDKRWDVYLPDGCRRLINAGSHGDPRYRFREWLHLSRSLRSFKDESVSEFINCLVDKGDSSDAAKMREMASGFGSRYPIRVTRDIARARRWLGNMVRANQSCGVIAHNKSKRLRSYGICLNPDLDVRGWFLGGRDSVNSSHYMEEVADQYQTQGLELDWTCVCWDANLRHNGRWDYNTFRGNDWVRVRDGDGQRSLRNSYRVLLTRARHGMVIFVPRGDSSDETRDPAYYDGIYEYLVSMGIRELGDEQYARHVPRA